MGDPLPESMKKKRGEPRKNYEMDSVRLAPRLREGADDEETLRGRRGSTEGSITDVVVPFYLGYLFHFIFLLDLRAVYVKVQVCASNLFRYVVYLFLSSF